MKDTRLANVRATEIVERFEVKTPPVPVERIAKQLGVIVQYAPFDDRIVHGRGLRQRVITQPRPFCDIHLSERSKPDAGDASSGSSTS